MVILTLCGVLSGIFFFFTYLKHSTVDVTLRYSKFHRCENSIYTSQDQFKEFAQIDKGMTLQGHGHGIYQCYCEAYSSLITLYDDQNFCY